MQDRPPHALLAAAGIALAAVWLARASLPLAAAWTALATVAAAHVHRHGREPVAGVQGVGAQVPDRDPIDRDPRRARDLALEAVQVGIDRSGFPPGIGEDRPVEPGPVTVGGGQDE